MRFILENKTIAGIPVLDIYQEDKRNAGCKSPLIIMLHGSTSKKEWMLPYGLEFAKEGFYTCLPDAYFHGELKPDNIKGPEDYDNIGLKQLLNIIEKTAQSINILLDYYSNNGFIDCNRAGLSGFSMGGLVIFEYLTKYYRENIKAAAPIIASPPWYNLSKSRFSALIKTALLSQDDIDCLKRNEPLNLIWNIKIPLLIQNGANDKSVPIEDVRSYYSILKDNYINENDLKFIEYPNVEHQVTDNMINEVKMWFKNYLC